MSAAAAPSHRDDGSGSSRGTTNGGGNERNRGEKESSGTMQLLDRLGYGLVSLSSSPGANEGAKGGGLVQNVHSEEDSADEGQYSSPVGGMGSAIAGTPSRIPYEKFAAGYPVRISRPRTSPQ